MPRKKPRTKHRVRTSKRFDRIPKGFHTVTPYLAINGAAQALEWYKRAFGAKELFKEANPDGRLIHARLKIGDSIVMMSDVFPGARHKDPRELGTTSVTLHVYTENVDEMWRSAVEAGATVEMQLEDMFWGERYGQLTDPYGHSWSLSMQIPMSKKEMEEKRKAAMQMFERGQHSSQDTSQSP